MKNAVLIALAAAALMCVTPAWSQGGPGGPPRGGGMAIPPPPAAAMIDSITTALGLTTDQATALKTVLATNDAAIQPLMDAARTAERAVRDAFVAADFDSAATLAQTASEAQIAVAKASITGWKTIQDSGILTADQFTTLLTKPCGPPPQEPGGGGSSSSARRR